MRFADGTGAEADIVIGADGLRSRVREVIAGLERPRYTGRVAFRAIFPVSLVRSPQLQDCVKWWGEDRILLSYYISSSRSELYIIAIAPQPHWPHDAPFVPAAPGEMASAFTSFHPEARELLAACSDSTKWAQYDCETLELWSSGRIVLLGDACHPMTPYMGQGAAMAIEDAAMLARCIAASSDDPEKAIRLYEASRRGRTAKMQQASRDHEWLRDKADPDWVFDYDVFEEPILEQ
jgi:6-hydroxynicotinate 3-monooxygenase